MPNLVPPITPNNNLTAQHGAERRAAPLSCNIVCHSLRWLHRIQRHPWSGNHMLFIPTVRRRQHLQERTPLS